MKKSTVEQLIDLLQPSLTNLIDTKPLSRTEKLSQAFKILVTQFQSLNIQQESNLLYLEVVIKSMQKLSSQTIWLWEENEIKSYIEKSPFYMSALNLLLEPTVISEVQKTDDQLSKENAKEIIFNDLLALLNFLQKLNTSSYHILQQYGATDLFKIDLIQKLDSPTFQNDFFKKHPEYAKNLIKVSQEVTEIFASELKALDQPDHFVLYAHYKLFNMLLKNTKASLKEIQQYFKPNDIEHFNNLIIDMLQLIANQEEDTLPSLETRIKQLKSIIHIYLNRPENYPLGVLVNLLITFKEKELNTLFSIIDKNILQKMVFEFRELTINLAKFIPFTLPDLAYSAIGQYFEIKPYVKNDKIFEYITKSPGIFFFHHHTHLASYQLLIDWMPEFKNRGIARIYIELPNDTCTDGISNIGQLKQVFDKIEQSIKQSTMQLFKKYSSTDINANDDKLEINQVLNELAIPFYFKDFYRLMKTAIHHGIAVYLIDPRNAHNTTKKDDIFSINVDEQMQQNINDHERQHTTGKFIVLLGSTHIPVANLDAQHYYPKILFLPTELFQNSESHLANILKSKSYCKKIDVIGNFNNEITKLVFTSAIQNTDDIILLPASSAEIEFPLSRDLYKKDLVLPPQQLKKYTEDYNQSMQRWGRDTTEGNNNGLGTLAAKRGITKGWLKSMEGNSSDEEEVKPQSAFSLFEQQFQN